MKQPRNTFTFDRTIAGELIPENHPLRAYLNESGNVSVTITVGIGWSAILDQAVSAAVAGERTLDGRKLVTVNVRPNLS